MPKQWNISWNNKTFSNTHLHKGQTSLNFLLWPSVPSTGLCLLRGPLPFLRPSTTLQPSIHQQPSTPSTALCPLSALCPLYGPLPSSTALYPSTALYLTTALHPSTAIYPLYGPLSPLQPSVTLYLLYGPLSPLRPSASSTALYLSRPTVPSTKNIFLTVLLNDDAVPLFWKTRIAETDHFANSEICKTTHLYPEIAKCILRNILQNWFIMNPTREVEDCSVSRWRPHKVDKRMVLEYTHGLFIT